MSCGVGCRYGSDLALLWLWRRPAAVALFRPLAWESPHVASIALKNAKKIKKKKKYIYIVNGSYITRHDDIYIVREISHSVPGIGRGPNL